MHDAQLQRIATHLRSLQPPGHFAAQHEASAQGLDLEVDGVGALRLPLTAGRVEALLSQAQPSPFGYRDQTLSDPSVRDSWEIGGEHVQLGEAWSERLERGIQALTLGLGFPPKAQVRCRLHKLLIYGPGQFFARHRDTEKEASTAATMVVVLPGFYDGGEVVVSHGGEEVVYDTARAGHCLSMLGFYVDCVHETRPVRAGHRVALTFTLDVEGAAVPTAGSDPADGLRASLQDFLAVEDDEERWLVCLLEHQYSHQSLGWERLKNGDRVRAEALRSAAERLDCHCLLALANTEETYAFHGGEYDDEDDEPAVAPQAPPPSRLGTLDWPEDDTSWADDRLPVQGGVDQDPDLGALESRTVTLVHGIDSAGRACTVPEFEVDDDCVLCTVEAPSWRSYAAEAEPWTGNEGGVAAKWFHLSAIVLVPKGGDWAPEPLAAAKPGRAPVRRVCKA